MATKNFKAQVVQFQRMAFREEMLQNCRRSLLVSIYKLLAVVSCLNNLKCHILNVELISGELKNPQKFLASIFNNLRILWFCWYNLTARLLKEGNWRWDLHYKCKQGLVKNGSKWWAKKHVRKVVRVRNFWLRTKRSRTSLKCADLRFCGISSIYRASSSRDEEDWTYD